ncbi:MAG: nucleotide exchange factor GrpE [Clostridia bacterium]|nr:nucleotide exchange factor GrpE [Clostridia bacterium]
MQINDESKNEEIEQEEITNEEVAEENNKDVLEEPEERDVSDMSREELEQEVENLKKDTDKYYKHLQRTAAEFDNFKKRVQKEKDAIYQLAVGDTVAKYINVLDNIDRALAVESSDDKMKEGIALVKKQMLEIMTSLGCTEIPTVGETFNPEFHDAVMHIESEEYGEQAIVEELRKGYMCGDRVIRHAMVKVAN